MSHAQSSRQERREQKQWDRQMARLQSEMDDAQKDKERIAKRIREIESDIRARLKNRGTEPEPAIAEEIIRRLREADMSMPPHVSEVCPNNPQGGRLPWPTYCSSILDLNQKCNDQDDTCTEWAKNFPSFINPEGTIDPAICRTRGHTAGMVIGRKEGLLARKCSWAIENYFALSSQLQETETRFAQLQEEWEQLQREKELVEQAETVAGTSEPCEYCSSIIVPPASVSDQIQTTIRPVLSATTTGSRHRERSTERSSRRRRNSGNGSRYHYVYAYPYPLYGIGMFGALSPFGYGSFSCPFFPMSRPFGYPTSIYPIPFGAPFLPAHMMYQPWFPVGC